SQSSEVRIGVDCDDTVAPQRCEGRPESDGGRGLADSALEREHGDPVVTRDGLANPSDELLVTFGAATVEQASGDLADTFPPAARRPARTAYEDTGGEVQVGWMMYRRRQRRRIGFRVRKIDLDRWPIRRSRRDLEGLRCRRGTARRQGFGVSRSAGAFRS